MMGQTIVETIENSGIVEKAIKYELSKAVTEALEEHYKETGKRYPTRRELPKILDRAGVLFLAQIYA